MSGKNVSNSNNTICLIRMHTRTNTHTKLTPTPKLPSELLKCFYVNCPSETPSSLRSYTLTNGCLNAFGLFICVVMRGFNQGCQGFETFL